METNDTDFLAKQLRCNTLWSLGRLVVVWEQFHDHSFCNCQLNMFPWEGFWEGTISWVFLAEKLPLTDMGCFSVVFWEENIFWILFSQKHISCDLCTSFACAERRRPLGGSSWKLLELTSVSFPWPMSLTHTNGESNQRGLWKITWWGKTCIQLTHECHD